MPYTFLLPVLFFISSFASLETGQVNATVEFILFTETTSEAVILSSMLDAHQDVLFDELFFGKTRDPVGAYSSFFEAQRENISAAGLLISSDRLSNYDQFHQFLRQRRPKVIQLIQKNRMRAVINSLRQTPESGRCTGKHNVRSIHATLETHCDVQAKRVNLKELKKELKLREQKDCRMLDFVTSLELETMFVFQEHVLTRPIALLQKIFKFLNSDTTSTKFQPSRWSSYGAIDSLSEIVVNYEYLYNSFKGTQYQRMFETSNPPLFLPHCDVVF